MITVEHEPEAPEAAAELSFERPVRRSLVHRRAVAEVFVTDAVRTDRDDRFAVAAQLPRTHAYFNDQQARPGLLDPLLLLECCRQAGTVVAHEFLDVPVETAFLITSWNTRLAGPDALRAGSTPDELTLLVTAEEVRRRAGRVQSATLRMDLLRAGRPLGRSTVAAGYLPKAGYRGYRELRRGSAPVLSDAMPAARAGRPVAAAAVGRAVEENVVLADVRTAPDEAEALLDVPTRHPAFYDHPLDHVPGMSLLEAARQAALLAAAGTAPGRRLHAVGLDAGFEAFVELDAPTVVRAVRTRASGADGERTVRVEFRQDEAVACAVDVTLADAGPLDASRGADAETPGSGA